MRDTINDVYKEAETAATNADTSATNANTAATEANTNAQNSNAASQYANSSATATDTASTTTNTGAQTANTASQNANTSSQSANTAATDADTASTNANTEATNANTASQNANSNSQSKNAKSFSNAWSKAKTAFNNSMIEMDMVGASMFKSLAKSSGAFISTFWKSLSALGKIGLIVGAIYAVVKIYDGVTESYEEATEKLEESKQEYEEAKSTLESLNSELKTTQERIEELNKQDTLTIVEEAELEKLKRENDELERKIALQEKITESKKKSNRANAENLLTKKNSYTDTYHTVGFSDVHVIQGTDAEILEGLVKKRNQTKDHIEYLYNSLAVATDQTAKKTIEAQISYAEEELSDYEEEMSTKATTISENIEYLDPNSDIYAKNYAALNMYSNMDKEGLERDLSYIDAYFNGSATRNAIKKKLTEATKAGKNASDVLVELGVDLDNAGLKADVLNDYFDELANKSDEVEKAINKVDGTLESVSSAFESDNKGKAYDTMLDYLEQALELYDKGFWGTDEFKEVAQWMTPEDILPDSDDLAYDAQAYKKAFEKTYKMVQDWFDPEDSLGSMWSFIDDMYSADSSLFSKLDKQSGEIIFNFDNTADAAEKLGVNVRVVDAMMRKLEEHGFELEGMKFAGEMIDEYNSAVKSLKETTDSLADKTTKKRFKDLIESFQNDIGEITEDKIINVKFEIDQASLIAETEKIEKEIRSTGGTVEQYGALNYNKGEILSNYEEDGTFDETKDSRYQSTKNSIVELERKLAKETDANKKMEIQKQIASLYDMLIDFQQVYGNQSDVNWAEYLKSEEAFGVLENLMDATEETREGIEKVLGEDIDVEELYVKQLENKINNLEAGGTITFDADVNGVVQTVKAVKKEDGTISYSTIIDGKEVTMDNYENLQVSKDGIITFTVKEKETGEGLGNWLTNLFKWIGEQLAKFGTPDTTLSPHMTGMGGGASVNGTAHSTGTTLWNNYRQATGQAYAGGHWGLYNNEKGALINELGSEIVVRDGKWFTVNDGYPAFTDLKKGDIVFNHKQSEELLKNGYVTGSHAKMIGSAHAQGTAFSGGILSTDSNTKDFDRSGSDKFEEIIDYIEIYLDRMSRLTEEFTDAIDKEVGLQNKQIATDKAIAQAQAEILANENAKTEYWKKANAVQLDETTKGKIRDGSLSIEDITNESDKEKIEDYQNWYDKILSCDDAIKGLNDSLLELAQTKFDNVVNEFENSLSIIEHDIDMIDGYIEQTEARGHLVSKKYYEEMMSTEQKNLDTLKNEYSTLSNTLNDLVNSGQIKEYSNEWYEMTGDINDVEKAILESETALIEYQNTMRKLDWEVFDKLQEKISHITEESDFLIDLMSNDKMYNDDGSITEQGQATLGLHALNYNTYMSQADDYANEMLNIDKELAKDPYNQELLEHRQELLESQRDSILAAEDEKQAMKDLVEEGYNSFLDSMQEIIDKRKEAMQEIKDLRDYEKNIADLNKEVIILEKREIAMRGDDSEEGRLQLQQIQNSLQEARENLEETEYERYLSDQEKMLDALYDETEQWMNTRLDDIDGLIEGVIGSVNGDADSIKATLEKESEAVGSKLSTEMSNIWSTDGAASKVVSEYGSDFSSKLTTTNDILTGIKNGIKAMLDANNIKADMDIDSRKKQNQNVPVVNPSNTPSTNQSTNSTKDTGNSSGNTGWGSWFIFKAFSGNKNNLNIDTSIVDRLKWKDFDSSESVRASYYKAMGGSGTYTGSSKQNRWMLEQMKSHGFAKGGTIGSLISKSGENGFILARTGEEVLSLEKIEGMKDVFEAMNPIANMLKSMPAYTQFNGVGGNTITNDIDMNIVLEGINNADEFITALKTDKKFEKFIQQITIGNAMGRNTLSKNRY